MNEIIRILAEQAGAKFFKDVIVVGDRGASGNATDFIPKFAELIVQECIDIVRMNYDETFSEADLRAMTILRKMKQHFGVE